VGFAALPAIRSDLLAVSMDRINGRTTTVLQRGIIKVGARILMEELGFRKGDLHAKVLRTIVLRTSSDFFKT
jgi:hypothetical protein